MCYKECEPKVALDSNWRDVTAILRELFANNFRLLFKFIRDLLALTYQICKEESVYLLKSNPEYLLYLTRFRGSEWLVFKLFIYGTANNQLFLNRTRYDEDGQPIFNYVTPTIPNIFNFNEYAYNNHELVNNIEALDIDNKVFVKLRMIQYVNVCGGKTGVSNIIKWLPETFNTKWANDLRYEIKELLFDNILGCEVSQIDIDTHAMFKRNHEVISTLKSIVVNKMLDTSIYYETVMDNTPIETRYSKYIKPLHRLDKPNVFTYLKLKSYYILFFIAYLVHCENIEKKRCNLSDKDYLFNYSVITPSRIKKIKESIVRYLVRHLAPKSSEYVSLKLTEIEDEIAKLYKYSI